MATTNGLPPEILDRVRAAMADHIARGFATGIVTLVGAGDASEVLTAGTKSLDAGAGAMRRDTIFRITSMTKPMTAAAAMMLVEDGRLRLDEPVDRLLPELADRRVLRRIDGELDDTVPAERPITVEDVLTFRLGFGVVMAPPRAHPIQRAIADLGVVGFGPPDPASPHDPDEWMRRLGTLPLMAQPGATWMYSAGSNVLGVLVARASGQTLPEFLQAQLFEPLGMTDTAFYVSAPKRGRLPDLYKPTADGLNLFDAAADTAWAKPPVFPEGDAGLVSTVDDYFAFTRLLLDKGSAGGRRLLSEAAVAAMTRNHLTPAQREGGKFILGDDHGWGYGMGVALHPTEGGEPAGSFGWGGGYGTSWLADPASGRTAIVMTQTTYGSPEPPTVHEDIWRAVFR